MSALILTTTDQVRVAPQHIPAEAEAVSWQRVRGENVWQYRMHRTVLGAKRQYGKNVRAYDSGNYAEQGWKIIDDAERSAGLWLW